MSVLSKRMIDYYLKDLPFEVRQTIMQSLEDIGMMSVKSLLEYPEDYPKLRKMGMNDAQIGRFSQQISEKFADINQMMTDHGRPPLFEEPFDSCKSAKRYVELLVRYHRAGERPIRGTFDFGKDSEEEEVLIQKMGCTWDAYVPVRYQPPK